MSLAVRGPEGSCSLLFLLCVLVMSLCYHWRCFGEVEGWVALRGKLCKHRS